MTLLDIIRARIASEGPMRLDEYMSTCLMHPTLGYYITRDPFGAAGDFITAPEISQMFGELIGLSIAQSWLDQGAPNPFVLAELGPGRGTLMADALRACAQVPGFVEAANIVLVEASPKLRAVQKQTLAPHSVTFCGEVEALPKGPLFVIANEFFDALPIRQFVRDKEQWREREVGLDTDALVLGLGPAQPQPALAGWLADTKDSDLVEICSAAAPIIDRLGQQIGEQGGAALIIDYGDWRTLGDTLQAVRAHDKVDVLTAPGSTDLTAHVDFEALAMACPCAHSRVTPQGVFLERLGISARAQKLAEKRKGDDLKMHIAAHRRLTHPAEMGNLFKVMALYPTTHAPPPGLER